MNYQLLSAVAFTTLLAVSGAVGTALVDRGGGMIHDTVLNITWLQDANYAQTSGYDADGKMTWDTYGLCDQAMLPLRLQPVSG